MNPEMEKFENRRLSGVFGKNLEEWGASIFNESIYNFLNQNKDICGLSEVNDYWKDKRMHDYCFEAIQAKNNGNSVNGELKENNGSNDGYEEDRRRQKELYEALKKYVDMRKSDFKEKEEKQTEDREVLKKEQKEILGYVRAMKDLEDGEQKDYSEEVRKQKIREGKGIIQTRGLLRPNKEK